MGNKVCKKCGVPAEYDKTSNNRNSCRIHNSNKNCDCLNKGNCYHKFESQYEICNFFKK